MAFWRLSQSMSPDTPGKAVLRKALTAPLRRIVENAGKDYAEVAAKLGENGYNAATDSYEDLSKSGVVDPTKVERLALENAVSAAGTVITTFATITDIPDEKERA